MTLFINPKKRKSMHVECCLVTSDHLPFPVIFSGCITCSLPNSLMNKKIKGDVKEGISKSALI